MKTSIDMVKEFNDSFEIEYPKSPTAEENLENLKHLKDLNFCTSTLETCGQTLNMIAANHKSQSVLRLQLITEEVAELSRAVIDKDIVAIYDALVDIQYVLDGAFLYFGLYDLKQKGLEEVHASNMSKLDKEGRPIKSSSGRVVKSPEYVAPNLAKFLKNE
jgi:predicted HAD superfamily Cof-like phosphohydrolase